MLYDFSIRASFGRVLFKVECEVNICFENRMEWMFYGKLKINSKNPELSLIGIKMTTLLIFQSNPFVCVLLSLLFLIAYVSTSMSVNNWRAFKWFSICFVCQVIWCLNWKLDDKTPKKKPIQQNSHKCLNVVLGKQ